MIIPIAIDLSEHDSIREYKHDGDDFSRLSKLMHNQPFLLVHDGDSMEHSHFYQQISQLPQKSRDAFRRICKKIPRRAVPDWNGAIEQSDQSTLHTFIRVVAMSKSKFHMLFKYDDDTYVAPHPTHSDIECATWKAIDETSIYSQMKQLKSTTIVPGSLRSTFWKERFAPVISIEKWKRIKLVDRYMFLGKNLDFTAIDFLLGKFDKLLTNPTEIEIFVQTDKYKSHNRRKKEDFDHFPDIINHLHKKTDELKHIAAIRIYSYDNDIGTSILHPRFMYLYSSRELLYSYRIDLGFKVMHDEKVKEACEFGLKLDTVPSDNFLYTKITEELTPSRTTKPDYKEGKVAVYIC